MPIESATYVADLNPANPVHTDQLNQTDAHERLIKSVLKATFPNLNGAVTATPAELNVSTALYPNVGDGGLTVPNPVGANNGATLYLGSTGGSNSPQVALETVASGFVFKVGGVQVASLDGSGNLTVNGTVHGSSGISSGGGGGTPVMPSGAIIMWSGLAASIPAGYYLCDGTNGTPDLRDKFVFGAGGAHAPNNAGGSTTVSGTTVSAGSHNHTGNTGTTGGHTHSGNTDSQGSHNHTGATAGHSLTINEIPSHNHTIVTEEAGTNLPNGYIVGQGDGVGAPAGFTEYTGSGWSHLHGLSTDGAHQHNLNVNAVADHAHSIGLDGSHTHDFTVSGYLPPYLALCFIMKA